MEVLQEEEVPLVAVSSVKQQIQVETPELLVTQALLVTPGPEALLVKLPQGCVRLSQEARAEMVVQPAQEARAETVVL